jgi:hypothetical protein
MQGRPTDWVRIGRVPVRVPENLIDFIGITYYKFTKFMQSKKFTLSREDVNYIGKRALIFLAPLALIYIPFVVTRIGADGFQLSDFRLNEFELGALVLYILNRLTTVLQLFLSGK